MKEKSLCPLLFIKVSSMVIWNLRFSCLDHFSSLRGMVALLRLLKLPRRSRSSALPLRWLHWSGALLSGSLQLATVGRRRQGLIRHFHLWERGGDEQRGSNDGWWVVRKAERDLEVTTEVRRLLSILSLLSFFTSDAVFNFRFKDVVRMSLRPHDVLNRISSTSGHSPNNQ